MYASSRLHSSVLKGTTHPLRTFPFTIFYDFQAEAFYKNTFVGLNMAIPYPEGEVLFKRNVLNHSSGFDADNEDSFYKHALIESAWNGWVAAGRTVNSAANGYLERETFKILDAQAWGTNYGVFDRQWCIFGDDPTGYIDPTIRFLPSFSCPWHNDLAPGTPSPNVSYFFTHHTILILT